MSSRLQSTHRRVIRYHSEVGVLYVPGIRARIPGETGGYYVVTNSAGFRSDVEFVKEPSGRPRILFFGDSFTAGDGCDNRERYPERVGEALGAEVYNYAVSGTSTDQQLLIYEKLAREVAADLIVIGVYVEDVERNKLAFRASMDPFSKRRLLVPKPYFKWENGALALHHVPVPRERPWASDVTGERLQREGKGPLRRLVEKPLQRFRNDPRLQAAGAAVEERLPWLVPAVRKRSGHQPFPDYASSESAGWRLMQAILVRFGEAAAPTPVLIVPIPEYSFYHDGMDPLYQPLFERLGAHVVDLTRALYELPWADKKRLAFARDSHFSPFGHDQVARVVADAIESRGLLRPARARADTPAPSLAAPMTLKSSDVSVPHRGPEVREQSNPRRPSKRIYVLGLSGFYHGSAAALVRDGEILAAAEEPRFSRVENDCRFPAGAANYCLEEAGIDPEDLTAVVYSDNAPRTFERLMHTLAALGPDGEEAWARLVPSWLRYKLHVPRLVREHLAYDGLVLHEPHHRGHAASAFYPSPFDRAAIVTLDGAGEWATGSIGIGNGRDVEILQEARFPSSVGLLCSAFTQLTGFAVGSGEVEMMALAPHGEPRYKDLILEHLVDLKEDGSVELDLSYFAFLSQPRTAHQKLCALFGGPVRKPGSPVTQRERDLARSLQAILDEMVLRTARHAKRLTGEKNLCLAGGVALDGVAGGRLLREGPFADVWIQPAAGHASGALGAALDVVHTYFEKPRTLPVEGGPRQDGCFFGPSYSDREIRAFLETYGYPHRAIEPAARAREIAGILAAGEVVGHFSGRLQFGRRSLGAAPDEARPEAVDVRGAPLVCTPDDAYRCFMRTEMDALVLGNFLLEKRRQPPWLETEGHVQEDPQIEAGGTRDRAFTEAVSSAFFSDFLPAASSLSAESPQVRTAFRRLPTTWTEVGRAADWKAAFAIPPALDGGSPDPIAFAAAVTSFWAPGSAAAMRRVLVKLLEMTLKLADPERSGEDERESLL